MSLLRLIDQTSIDFTVRIDPAIPQKRPVCALLVYTAPIHVGHHNLFPVEGTFCDDFTVRAANKTLSPKFDAVAVCRRFMTDTVWDCDIASICDCVTPLDGFPGGMLRRAELLFFRWVPTDCCRIKNNLRSV